MKSKKINSKKVFYTLAILFVLALIVVMLIVMCPGSSKVIKGELVLADMNPIVYDQSTHIIEGTIPSGATLKIGEEIIETSGEFQHTLKLDKSPSFTSASVQMLDKKGNVIQEEKVTVENIRNMNVWIQIDNPEMIVEGKAVVLDVPATVVKDQTLLPFRAIGDAFGAKTAWVPETKTAVTKFADTTIELQSANGTIKLNSVPVELDVPPQIISDRTMVSVRPVAQWFGAEIEWNGTEKSITLKKEIHP